MLLIYLVFVTTTCIKVIFSICNFSVHNKRLPEDNVKTSKHLGVLKERDIVNIYCAFVGQV
jgi:hypothetical protein